MKMGIFCLDIEKGNKLADRMRKLFPQYDIEVIKTGTTTSGRACFSSVWLDELSSSSDKMMEAWRERLNKASRCEEIKKLVP